MLSNYARDNNLQYVIGIDEVGWGSLAGPVVLAGVVLPPDFESELIRDSKKLSEKKRKEAYDLILENAVAYSIMAGSVKRINNRGVETAKNMAISDCISEVSDNCDIEHILMDGIRFDNTFDIPHTCVPKGDNKYLSIAAASIIAKVRRDEYMVRLSEQYQHYGWDSNKGYGTKVHTEALKEHGATPYHRNKYVKNFV